MRFTPSGRHLALGGGGVILSKKSAIGRFCQSIKTVQWEVGVPLLETPSIVSNTVSGWHK